VRQKSAQGEVKEQLHKPAALLRDCPEISIYIFPGPSIIRLTQFLVMATVDMRRVNFWLPPDFPPNTQRTSLQKHHRGSVSTAAKSRNKAVSLCNKAESMLKRSGDSKPAVVLTQKHEFSTYSKVDGVKFQGRSEAE
jgi:hypothetical protein